MRQSLTLSELGNRGINKEEYHGKSNIWGASQNNPKS